MTIPIILFVPVSSVQGIGEYSRSLIIAKSVKHLMPKAQIHFVLNKHVKYVHDCPFPTHYSNHSATQDTPAVIRAIRKTKPDLVVFDCAGRAKQYAVAKSAGARVIFISQHRKKRARGMIFRRQKHIDLHWVVQPDFAIDPLTWLEKFKLQLMRKPKPVNIGPILPPFQLADPKLLLQQYNLSKEEYFVFSAGSGGHQVDNTLVADLFYEVATSFQCKTGKKCLVIFGENYPKTLPVNSKVICIKSLPATDFVALLNAAFGRILGAGDTLLQAIALHKPSVGVAISKDQPIRLGKCVEKGFVIEANASHTAIFNAAISLLNANVRNKILLKLNSQKAKLGLDIAISEIKKLLTNHP